MLDPEVAHDIRRCFRYLFEEFGYALAIVRQYDSFGNWAVVLESGRCGLIRITQDRGEVFLAISPRWTPVTWQSGPWYGLDVVIRYLSSGRDRVEPAVLPPAQQLDHLATLLRPYVPQLCDLFEESAFADAREGLEQLRQEVEDEVWQRLLGGNHTT